MNSAEQVQTAAWQRSGAWYGGTIVTVAAAVSNVTTGQAAYGLAGGRAGLFWWRADNLSLGPAMNGITDPSIVSVEFGGEPSAPTAWAATETGRLYRLDQVVVAGALGPWQEVSAWAGLGVASVLTPSPNFATDRTFFAATANGIFRTLNGGEHWDSCNFGLLDTEVLCLRCAPNYAERELLWAGTASGGLYRSRNGGRAWRDAGIGLPDAPVQAMVISPNFATDATLFVGMEEEGVYCSQDGGENWHAFGLRGESVNSLTITPQGRLLAGTFRGLFASALGAATWQPLTDEEDAAILAVASTDGWAIVGTYGEGVGMAALASTATGVQATWHTIETPLHAPPVVAAATEQDWVAIDGDGEVAHTTDAGTTWQTLKLNDIEGVFGISGGIAAAGQPVYFAATGDGLLHWDADEDVWQRLEQAAWEGHHILAVEIAPNFRDNETVLVMGHDGIIFISNDGGLSWREVVGLWPGQTLLQAHFAPHGDTQEMVALSTMPTEEGHFALNLWESHDQGRNWENLASLTSGLPAALITWPRDDTEQALYLATQHRLLKIYSPTPNDAADVDDETVLQHFFDENTQVTALAASPNYSVDHTVWAATTAALFESQDRGETWQKRATLPEAMPIVSLLPQADTINAITLGGQSWRLAR